MDNFGCLNSSLSLFYFYFATNLRKKIYVVHTLTAESPPSPLRASTLLARPPLPLFERTYFIDDPFRDVNLQKAKTWKAETLKICRFSEFKIKLIILLQWYVRSLL